MQKEPIQVLYLIDGLEGDGAERQFCELVKGIHKSEGYVPHVGVLESNDSGHAWMLEELGITVNRFERQYRFDLMPIPKIVTYIKNHRIDLVHTYLSMGSEFGLIAGKLCCVPVITSSIRDGMNRDWREAVRTWYQSHLGDIAVANSLAGFTSRFKKIRKKFRVINNGFDLKRFRISDVDRAQVLNELNLTGNEKIVCMAARMEPQKDHRSLIAAVAKLAKTYPDIVLLLAGQGSKQTELEEYCKDLSVANRTRFIGHRRDIESVFSVCHVSVLLTNTRIHHEGISNTIIESMAMGAPVVATCGGGTDEILADTIQKGPPYEFGIKVDVFNVDQIVGALSYLLSNESERMRIGQNAKAMVERRFNLSRFLDLNLELYRELERKGRLRHHGARAQ